MNARLAHYQNQFSSLTRGVSAKYSDRPATQGRAPHKPLLLLAVLDLIAEGNLPTNLIELDAELGELFNIYWSLVMGPDDHTTIALPFFHLTREGFWHLVPRPGHESFVEQVAYSPSLGQLQETTLGARLDDDLYDLLCVEGSREALRRVLIKSYFAPAVHERLQAQGAFNVQAYHYGETLLAEARQGKTLKERAAPAQDEMPVRDQGFRRAVVSAYDHRCAFCGVRIVTADGHTAIEAAHIVPWSETFDDRIGNGMALCRLCHWTFDEGLATVGGRYRIRLSPQLSLLGNMAGHLGTVDGRALLGPAEEVLWPEREALAWHRSNVYRTR